jgi:glycerophosphoryl diester phosphodiesterase
MVGFTLPEVIGHRGAAAYAPENTLEGIREAARRGVRWVEFDAKLTADHVVVLMHDDSLDRTTNGQGLVAQTDYAEILALDGGGWFGAPWRGARVPMLAEALDLILELDMRANVEIKPCAGRDDDTAEAVVDVIRRAWPTDRPWPLLSSFSEQSLSAAQDAAPEIPRGLLIWTYAADWAEAAARLGCQAVHCAQEHLTAPWAAAIRSAGFALAAYTVNDPAHARALLDSGVQCLISDCPDALLGVFRCR